LLCVEVFFEIFCTMGRALEAFSITCDKVYLSVWYEGDLWMWFLSFECFWVNYRIILELASIFNVKSGKSRDNFGERDQKWPQISMTISVLEVASNSAINRVVPIFFQFWTQFLEGLSILLILNMSSFIFKQSSFLWLLMRWLDESRWLLKLF
jgi:hypothetical protein